MDYLVNSFFAFLLTILFTPILIEVLKKYNIVDKPDNSRKLHKEPIPKLGGIAIFLIFTWFILIKELNLNHFKYFLVGYIIVLIAGLLDDFFDIKWFYKLFLQIISSLFFVIFLQEAVKIKYYFFTIELSEIYGIALLFIFLLGALNTFNLLDGLDGLVSGNSLLYLIMCIFLLQNFNDDEIKYLAAIMIGIMLGFLKFNSYPAKIFLGDTGSLFLGYVVTGLVILTYIKINSNNLDFAFLGFIYALNIIDTLRVIIKRLKAKKSPFLPDRNHLHHIFIDNKISHKFSVILVLLISLFSILIGLVYVFLSKIISTILFIILFIVLLNFPNIFYKLKESLGLLNIISIKKFLIKDFLDNLIKYFFTPLIIIVILIIIILNFQNLIIINWKFLILIWSYNIFVLTYAIINIIKRNYLDILFFFNLFFFFLLSNFNTFYEKKEVSNFLMIIDGLITVLLLIFIAIYLLEQQKNSLGIFNIFTGNDLIIFLLILTFNLYINIIPKVHVMLILKDILTKSFLIYIFYKIFNIYYQKIRVISFLLSFILVNLYVLKITLYVL